MWQLHFADDRRYKGGTNFIDSHDLPSDDHELVLGKQDVLGEGRLIPTLPGNHSGSGGELAQNTRFWPRSDLL